MMWHHLEREHRIQKPGAKASAPQKSKTAADPKASEHDANPTKKDSTPSTSEPSFMKQMSIAGSFARDESAFS